MNRVKQNLDRKSRTAEFAGVSFHGSLLAAAIALTVGWAALITTDALSGETTLFALAAGKKVANIFATDALAFVACFIAALTTRGPTIWQKTGFIWFVALVGMAVLSGQLGTRFSGYPKVALVGAEFRGLVSWLLVAFAAATYFSDHPEKLHRGLVYGSVVLLGRCAVEVLIIRVPNQQFAFPWVVDSATLITCATFAIIWLWISLCNRRQRQLSTFFSIVFTAIVFIAFRRTAMVLAFFGCAFAIVYFGWLKKTWYILMAPLTVIVALGLYFSTQTSTKADSFFYARFAGVFDEDARTASDREHIADMEDAIAIIGENPILGAGMGTETYTRAIGGMGDIMPFHSAYYHTWVRMGIVGFMSYLLFAGYLLLKSQRGNYLDAARLAGDIVTYQAVSIGLAAQILLQVKFPPFYLDQKLLVFDGCLLGIILSASTRTAPRSPLASRQAHQRNQFTGK